MSGWESLYLTATGDYNNGNYKDSYINYLKAANALIYKLNTEVSFANRDTVKTKPLNTAHLFTQLKSCVHRLEDILQNKVTNSSPQPSYISDLLITASPTPQHLPLIPFSPLTRHSMHYAHQLATANQKVSIIKQKSSDNNNQDDLSTLRRLDEEIRHHRNKLDSVNSQIQSIGEVTLLHWDDANDVSKQLTIIESELYKKVDLRKDLTLKDKRTSKAQACMDFHRYLTNSFTHQFMIHADTTRSSVSPRGAQQNVIAHAVKIAHLLLNVHRNFNSFAALIKALTSPEVRRIRKQLWNNLPSRTNQYLKELSSYIKKEDSDYKAYKDILAQKLESFRDVGKGMVVIPWMQPHYEEIKNITQSYTSTGVILSAPGQHKLASIFSLLEQCQSNVISDDELHFNGTRKTNPHKSTDGATINSPPDLSCMGNGNMDLHHWLVSRVYLTKQQLIDESMEIEPLGENEQPLCVENEYEEEEGEESDQNSVGRYDIGSEDSGDNIEAGTSSNHEMTNGSISQSNKPSSNKSEDHSNLLPYVLSKPSLTSNESGSKSIVNGTSSTSVSCEISKSEEFNIGNIDDSIGTNSLINTSNSTTENSFSSFMDSSKTKAIPIPQPTGQKSHQPSLSPASMLTNLNPNAQPFVPRALSSSAPGPTSDTLNRINVSLRDLTEMGEKNKIITTDATEDDEDGAFVYPIKNKSDDNDDDDDDDDDDNDNDDDEGHFVYKPQTPTETEANPSNGGLKDNVEEEDDIFIYNSEDSNKEEKPIDSDENNSQDENDDGEGSSFVYPTNENTSSDYNINNINIKNGMNGVSAKADKPSDSIDQITVKLSALSGEA